MPPKKSGQRAPKKEAKPTTPASIAEPTPESKRKGDPPPPTKAKATKRTTEPNDSANDVLKTLLMKGGSGSTSSAVGSAAADASRGGAQQDVVLDTLVAEGEPQRKAVLGALVAGGEAKHEAAPDAPVAGGETQQEAVRDGLVAGGEAHQGAPDAFEVAVVVGVVEAQQETVLDGLVADGEAQQEVVLDGLAADGEAQKEAVLDRLVADSEAQQETVLDGLVPGGETQQEGALDAVGLALGGGEAQDGAVLDGLVVASGEAQHEVVLDGLGAGDEAQQETVLDELVAGGEVRHGAPLDGLVVGGEEDAEIQTKILASVFTATPADVSPSSRVASASSASVLRDDGVASSLAVAEQGGSMHLPPVPAFEGPTVGQLAADSDVRAGDRGSEAAYRAEPSAPDVQQGGLGQELEAEEDEEGLPEATDAAEQDAMIPGLRLGGEIVLVGQDPDKLLDLTFAGGGASQADSETLEMFEYISDDGAEASAQPVQVRQGISPHRSLASIGVRSAPKAAVRAAGLEPT